MINIFDSRDIVSFLLILWLVGIFGITYSDILEQENLCVYAEEVSSEYQVYLDGVLVDAEDVDFSQYEISINDEKQKIYLTKE